MQKLLTTTILVLITICINAQDFKINSKGYFENHGANVMVFNDVYPEGHQGGITIVLNGNRWAGCGDVRMETSPGQWQGLPKIKKRTVNNDSSITVELCYPDSAKHLSGFNPMVYTDFVFNYTLNVKAVDDYLLFTVDIDREVPELYEGKIGFNLELVPATLIGKPWIMDEQVGVFPRQVTGPTISQHSNFDNVGDFNPRSRAKLEILVPDRSVFNPMVADDVVSAPLATGKKFVLNPHDELSRITIESLKGDLKLYDGRMNHNNGWFVLRTEFKAGDKGRVAEWKVKPTVTEEWRYKPVVQTSQVGYHPKQKKVAIIELDHRDNDIKQVELLHITADGTKTIKKTDAHNWGMFWRYNYLQFDFSDITQTGIYQVKYGDSFSPVFQIDPQIYNKGVWQTELEYFLPIQMCHMRVNEKYRVWHDYCHHDDARMAPTGINHIDGYSQGESTLCKYQPGDIVPGLNIGGWHDAGDYDLRIESQAGEAYLLAMAYDNYNVYWDETSIDFNNHIVELHQPDGKNDMLQQVENGALTIVAGWNALGRLYRGILCPTVRQYVHLGDASAHTDGVSGNSDDRWVFTEENPSREIQVSAWLAGISRVLRGHNDTLSVKCLEIAETLYDSLPDNNRLKTTRLHAAVELYLTTKNKKYSDYILSEQEHICKNITQTGWFIGRFDQAINNKKFSKAIREALPGLKDMYTAYSKQNPYGIPENRGNSSSGSWEPQHLAYNYCYLVQSYPDIFEPDYIFNAINYLLGVHPGQNQASLVSGVGAESATMAYGTNRAEWSYIPGGVTPGTNLIRPDLPEWLKYPFIWQQGEYCMGGHTTWFMYMVIAANHILNND